MYGRNGRLCHQSLITFSHRQNYIPDVICGDFDSARQDVLRFYESKVGVSITHQLFCQ